MKVRIILGVLATVTLLAATARAQDPKQEFLKYGDVISGQARAVHTKHPNGTPVIAYQIVSDAPKPFAHKDACKAAAPKTFHLAETDNKAKTIRLKRSVGKKIEVVADEFTCSKATWHIGDAIVAKWRFTGPPER